MTNFGLSAIYFKEGDFVEVTITVQDDITQELKASDVLDGTLRLYKNNVEITSIKFNKNYALTDGYIKGYFNHPMDVTGLNVRGSIIITSGATLTATADVSTDSGEDRQIPLSKNVARIEQHSSPDIIPDYTASKETPYEEEPWDEPVINSSDPIMLYYDAEEEFDFLSKGQGSVYYTGGGNRLLTKFDDTYVIQETDQFYNDISAKPQIELGSTNLQLNSILARAPGGLQPTGYTWSVTKPSVMVDITNEELYSDFAYQAYRLRATDPYDGTEVKAKFGYGSKITVDPTKSVMVSILTKVVVNDSASSVDSLDFVVKFYNSSDVLLDTVVQAFTVSSFSSGYNTLEHHTPTVPVGTAKIDWYLELYSLEGADDVTWYLGAPQVEQIDYSSSRIKTTTAIKTRSPDILTLPQTDNIRLDLGRITFTFVPLISSYTQQTFFFDTRDSSGKNGFSLCRATNGRILLTVADSTGTTVNETSAAVSFISDENVIKLSWSATSLVVVLNDVEIINRSGSYSGPEDVNEFIALAAKYDGTLQLPCIPVNFEVRRFL